MRLRPFVKVEVVVESVWDLIHSLLAAGPESLNKVRVKEVAQVGTHPNLML